MTASLEIHDLPETVQIEVRLVEPGGDSRQAGPSAFGLELSDEERVTLNRYHAEYRRPSLVWGSSGGLAQVEAVEGVMRNLGRLLFEITFGANSGARVLLDDVMGRDDRAELTIVSSRPEFLSLPWELMNDPSLGYFVNGLVGVLRQSTGSIPSNAAEERTKGALHVAMLSATPLDGGTPSAGELLERSVVAGGNLATATVAALEGLNVEVSLDNPRPATLDALRALLERNPDHYDIAHIDGATLDAAGAILLERDDGGAEAVAPTDLGKVLADGGVPVALISAGAQADEGTAARWSAAAMAVAAAGVAQVALLPAPLHPDMAEGTARAFYTRLAQGNSVGGAIASVRRGLMDTPERVTIYGKRVFWDWQMPAVYQSRRYAPAEIEQHQPDPLAPPVIQPEEAPTDELQIPAAGQYGLVGREGELRQLERALKAHSVALLSGDTGVGKTELALGLSRWFLKPARVVYPGGVFYTAFEASHPAGIERVVHEIGTAVAGLDFADMPAEQQRRWVTAYLQQNPSLLVWDNVENVSGFPDGSPGLLDETELPDLAAFLGEVTTGPVGTGALLLSRREDEDWITIPHATLTLGGLTDADRLAFAGFVMDKGGVPATRVGADFGELVELLDGHPLAMQMAIPPVKDVPASVVAGELRSLMTQQPDGGEPGRSAVLTAAMEYGFSRLVASEPDAPAVPVVIPA